MLNLFKMNLRQLFRSKVFYILLACLIISVLSFVLMADKEAGLKGVLGVPTGDTEADFMGAMMGSGIVWMFLGLLITLSIGSDFASGYTKNIFTVHANKFDYIIAKGLVMLIAGGIFTCAYFLVSIVLSAATGVAMNAGAGGVIIFIFQKLLMLIPFIAMLICVMLWARNRAVGTVSSFLLGSGGLIMGLTLFFGIINVNGAWLTGSTVFGAASLIGVTFSGLGLLRTILVTVAWTGIYGFLSSLALRKRDI